MVGGTPSGDKSHLNWNNTGADEETGVGAPLHLMAKLFVTHILGSYEIYVRSGQ